MDIHKDGWVNVTSTALHDTRQAVHTLEDMQKNFTDELLLHLCWDFTLHAAEIGMTGVSIENVAEAVEYCTSNYSNDADRRLGYILNLIKSDSELCALVELTS